MSSAKIQTNPRLSEARAFSDDAGHYIASQCQRVELKIPLLRSVLPRLLLQLGGIAAIGGIVATRGQDWRQALEIACYLLGWLGAISVCTLLYYQRVHSKRRASTSSDAGTDAKTKDVARRRRDDSRIAG